MDMEVPSVGAAAGAMAALLVAISAAFWFGRGTTSRSTTVIAAAGARPRAEPQPEPEPEPEPVLPPSYLFWGAVSGGRMVDRAIASLPRRELKEASDDCAVCLGELAAGETARVLPRCGHAFHMECVDAWLRSCRANCPLCRRDVVHINDMVMPAPLPRGYPRVRPGPPVPFVRNRNLN